MAKKIVGYIKLQVPAGKANPSPPIGPALGQRGLNIMEFCKEFNAQTQKLEPGMPIPVVITAYADRTFTFVTKTPPNTYFLMKAAGIEKGSQTPGKGTVGKVTMAQIREIAEKKMVDLNANDVERRVPHDRRLGPLHGPSRWWSKTMAQGKRLNKAPTTASTATQFYPLAEAVKLVKAQRRRPSSTRPSRSR